VAPLLFLRWRYCHVVFRQRHADSATCHMLIYYAMMLFDVDTLRAPWYSAITLRYYASCDICCYYDITPPGAAADILLLRLFIDAVDIDATLHSCPLITPLPRHYFFISTTRLLSHRHNTPLTHCHLPRRHWLAIILLPRYYHYATGHW